MKAVLSVKLQHAWAATAGCLVAMLLSGGAATSQAAPVPRVPLLFVGQGQPNQTTIYNTQNQPIGIVPAGDGTSAFDLQGNFYDVPSNANALLIFAPPYKHESARIGFSAVPFSVAVDTRTGVFAVSVYDGNVSTVQFFRHGSQTPCDQVVAQGAGLLGGGSAFDREGRLFIADYENNGYVTVASVAGECNATSVQVYQFPSSGINPEPPFTFTAEDNLVFQDGPHNGYHGILTFAHPQNGRFAKPLTTTKLTPINSAPAMTLACLAGDGKHLWAIPVPYRRNAQTLAEYRYPQGGSAIATITLLHPYTCAAYPPIVP